MKLSYMAEEVDDIEDRALDFGIASGRRAERERIIKLLISEEVLNPDDEHDQDVIDLIREDKE